MIAVNIFWGASRSIHFTQSTQSIQTISEIHIIMYSRVPWLCRSIPLCITSGAFCKLNALNGTLNNKIAVCMCAGARCIQLRHRIASTCIACMLCQKSTWIFGKCIKMNVIRALSDVKSPSLELHTHTYSLKPRFSRSFVWCLWLLWGYYLLSLLGCCSNNLRIVMHIQCRLNFIYLLFFFRIFCPLFRSVAGAHTRLR